MDADVVVFVVEGDMCAPVESDDGTYVGAKVGKYVVGASEDKVADGKFVGDEVEEAAEGKLVGASVEEAEDRDVVGAKVPPLLSFSYAQS